jgi:hypothetical protein
MILASAGPRYWLHAGRDLNDGINIGESRSVSIVSQSVIFHLNCVRLLPAYFKVFDAVSDFGIHVPTNAYPCSRSNVISAVMYFTSPRNPHYSRARVNADI